MPMIDHLSLGVRDLARSGTFYDAVLAPLGYVRLADWDPSPEHPWRSVAYGPPGSDPFGKRGEAPLNLEERPGATPGGAGFHLCFQAPDRNAVHEFHRIGIEQGARDYGAPGPREHYGPGYYASFLIDPDGWRIEAVTYSAT